MEHSPECLSADTALGLGMDTDTIGLALIVGGAAFVCGGLVSCCLFGAGVQPFRRMPRARPDASPQGVR